MPGPELPYKSQHETVLRPGNFGGNGIPLEFRPNPDRQRPQFDQRGPPEAYGKRQSSRESALQLMRMLGPKPMEVAGVSRYRSTY